MMSSRSGPSSPGALREAVRASFVRRRDGEQEMKCRVCREPAIIDLPRHNANFCAEHFLELCRRQVRKAIDDFDMLAPDDRVLVAVSGGKDSLAVWDMLVELGYRADGLYIGLGIGDYSEESAG